MKQIPFDASLIGKPGIEVKYKNDERTWMLKPDFLKVRKADIISIDPAGNVFYHDLSSGTCNTCQDFDLLMYRQPRTAEEIATEVSNNTAKRCGLMDWDNVHPDAKDRYIALVQAGMDEMTHP